MRQNTLCLPRAFPGAVVTAPRAESDPATLVRQVTAAFADFQTRSNTRMSEIEACVDDLAKQGAYARLGGGGTHPDDPEYTKLFASYFRAGVGEDAVRAANAAGQRANIQAAMSVGTNSDGGYLAPTEWDRKIRQAMVTKSPIRRLATVETTSVGAFSTVWNGNDWGSGWVGETAARPATSTPTLSNLVFDHGEIYANVAITQRLLDDAAFNLEEWIATQVETEFGRQEDIAFISGNGTNKPRGMLTYVTGGVSASVHPGGVIATSTVADDVAVTPDELVDFSYSLPAPYRANAVWLMNSLTAAKIAKLKNGDGDYIWREGLIVGQPATLLGRPVELDESMPAMAAGNLPIAFGDFKAGYLINDRLGTRILRDPFTNKPYVMFYVTKRVGGGVQDPNAIKLIKMAAS